MNKIRKKPATLIISPRMLFFILPYFLLLINISIQSGAEIPMGGNKFSTIRIEYSIKGKYQSGREIFIQKDGKTSKETYIETSILDKTFYEHTLEIDDGGSFFRINLINKTGMKLPSLNNLKRKMIENNPHLFDRGNPNPLSIIPQGGMLKKTEIILDKECSIYLSNNRMYYIWENIILKEVLDVIEKSVKSATKLDIDTTVEDSVFQVPENILFPEKEQL